MDNEGLDRDVFGPLVDIPEPSLVALATRISQEALGHSQSSGKVIATLGGSYNILHVVQLECSVKIVIRVPATGWGVGLTTEASQSMESHVATVRLLRQETQIPVPEILAMDTSSANEIGAPYICMTFVPGKSVSKVWFDGTGAIPQEQLRLNILKSVAQNMAQLSNLSFNKIGSIMASEGEQAVIGPCFDWKESDDGSVAVTTSGPFDTTSAYLLEHAILASCDSIWGKAKTRIMSVVQDCLVSITTKPGFALTLPDFDSQNIMVDDHGTVTGFIDLDLIQTMPRFVGFCRYPGWITRDWDPLMYGWPKMADSEDPPQTLERYRAYYNEELGKALEHQGDWTLTKKSHILEAMWIASLNPVNRLEICRKLVHEALDGETDATDVLYDIGADDYKGDQWEKLVAGMKRLIF
ncbi:hypothetical protein S7711_03393 [Stachybotrys chartarum IBT 7711]|uniref:Aminoglycoside phosphotransferase domain-containing protein n=1 Tax=Stachybotrys chartarum (strain CBS 109288 / IBT 7711) TaxID=1280523 RepID=A0A084AXZ3_STACB|nr:hypothetical protein S7711_03393 [Stachybotrys chartarum IBT 7711]